ncbi:SulP family inorganic anion transporter [Roseiarcus sp.]|uniref:SulP family inorganic anion transporter n=1 Tax=Roseiarcus sp. TaxID=1969460 RepID=UPI003F94591B
MLSIPFLQGVLPFRPREALKDALAGVTLASMNIPQVLGYTRIAGTPIVTGLYTVLLPLVGFALFGSSRHLVVAADSATAAIFSSAVSRMAPVASEKYMALVGMLTLLTAGLLLLARIFKLGFLADFLARTALVGFLTGVGIQVGVAMLGSMLGVDVQSHSTLGQIWEVGAALSKLSPLTLGLSVFVVAVILLGKWLVPKLPVPLVVVVGMIAASAWLDLAGMGVAVVGPVPGGLPALRWPDVTWRETLDLLPVAGSCFVMIIAQSAATSRVYGIKHHERVDENADILGIAAANAGAALTGAFVVNGSPTQTAMADDAGARSQFAQLVFAAIVAIVLIALTGFLQYLPRCVLAGIVFTIAVGMIDVKGLKDILSESAGEFRLALLTAAAVPCIGVEEGILLAIALSLVRHVRHSYRPHTMVLTPDPEGGWISNPAEPGAQTRPGLILYRFGADLFYANADRFADEARALVDHAPDPVEWFVVDAGAITDIDYSAARTLRDLFSELTAKNISVAFGRAEPSLRSDLERHGVAAILGEGRIYPSLHGALALVGGGETQRPASQ